MPVLYLLIFLVGASLYLAYVACALPVGAALALVCCVLGLPGTYFRDLGRVLLSRGLMSAGSPRWPKPPGDADPAVLQYFYGPARADADHAVRTAARDCRLLLERYASTVGSAFVGDAVVLTGPIGVGGAVGLAVGSLLGAAAATACACVHLLTVGACATGVRCAGAALRLADSTMLRVKNIRMTCPRCGERVPYPGYECPRPSCERKHRDIRPGRLGLLRRYCLCGMRMRTLLLFGSSGMSAFCPRCGQSLEHRPGKTPETVLPLFGTVGAGKTRLLFSLVTQLGLWSEASTGHGPPGQRFRVEFADAETAAKLEHASELLSPDSVTAKTPAELPRAYIIRLSAGQGGRILHMFDPAGELTYSADQMQRLRFLDKARTFILVIDPLSVPSFWNRVSEERRTGLETARETAPSPNEAYQLALQEIEAMGVSLRRSRLAVAFSRADLTGERTEDVASWATRELGLGNLVRLARLNFGEACFFRTSAVLTGGIMHESIPALLRWVLEADGIEPPREPE